MMGDDQRKRGDALRRAIPVTPMLDYGFEAELAQEVHDRVAAGAHWEEVLTAMAEGARGEDRHFTAAAAMNYAQMALNFDTGERVSLLRQGLQDFARWAAEAIPRVTRYELTHAGGRLLGWRFGAATAPVVIVVGGMSGWATSFTGMARALRAEGLGCLLLDGPGQGETRIDGGLCLQHGYPEAIRAVVDDLLQAGVARVGIWGNSMGGLFAAISARENRRIAACCINVGPTRLAFPEFRTAREQMAACSALPIWRPPR